MSGTDRARRLGSGAVAWLDAPWLPTAILIIGIAIRAGFALHRWTPFVWGEAGNVAHSLAAGRGFVDAYFPGSGPTTHVMPTTPLLAGGVLTLFAGAPGVGQIVLIAIATAEVALVYWLAFDLFGRLGVPRWQRVLGLAALALVPVNLLEEALKFQYWDSAVATILALLAFRHLFALIDGEKQGSIADVVAATLLALLVFVNPVTALGLLFPYAIVYLTRRPWVATLRAAGTGIVLLVALFTPWTIHNLHALKHPIVLRDNLGLELGIANYPGAVEANNPGDFYSRIHRLHPVENGPARPRIRQMGEVAYYKALQADATAWIKQNPGGFLLLCARHASEMIWPRYWQIGESFAKPRAAIIWLFDGFGVIAILIGCFARRPHWRALAIFIGVIALAYGPFQPTSRYMYPLYILLTFAAFAVPHVWASRRA